MSEKAPEKISILPDYGNVEFDYDGKYITFKTRTLKIFDMYKIELGKSGMSVPTIAVGCMRISKMSEKEASAFVNTALEKGAVPAFLIRDTGTSRAQAQMYSLLQRGIAEAVDQSIQLFAFLAERAFV